MLKFPGRAVNEVDIAVKRINAIREARGVEPNVTGVNISVYGSRNPEVSPQDAMHTSDITADLGYVADADFSDSSRYRGYIYGCSSQHPGAS